jgi:hypothetical protein
MVIIFAINDTIPLSKSNFKGTIARINVIVNAERKRTNARGNSIPLKEAIETANEAGTIESKNDRADISKRLFSNLLILFQSA